MIGSGSMASGGYQSGQQVRASDLGNVRRHPSRASKRGGLDVGSVGDNRNDLTSRDKEFACRAGRGKLRPVLLCKEIRFVFPV